MGMLASVPPHLEGGGEEGWLRGVRLCGLCFCLACLKLGSQYYSTNTALMPPMLNTTLHHYMHVTLKTFSRVRDVSGSLIDRQCVFLITHGHWNSLFFFRTGVEMGICAYTGIA